MVRRYVRRKRAYKKKRYVRRKRMYKGPKADGSVYTRIHSSFDMTYESANGWGAIYLNWAGNSIPLNTNTARLTTTAEFTRFTTNYQEYSVRGIKWTFIPMTAVNTTADTGFYYTEYASNTREVM